jgi:MtaA/CmuA family methyltransferase
MNALEKFKESFRAEGTCSDLLSMPLIMTFAAKHSGVCYREYIRDPKLMAHAQFAVCTDFGVDVLATTSDPVSELSSLGGDLIWFSDDPPAPDPTRPLLERASDITKLKIPDPHGRNRMADRLEAIKEMRRLSDGTLPVLGWVEGPISEAAVMRGMTTLMEDLIDDPEFIDELFCFNVRMAIRYAEAQIEAGADMIGFGDAPASLIGPEMYERFVLPQELRIVNAIHDLGVPVRMHICGNTTKILPLMAQSGVDMVDIDSVTDFEAAADAFGPTVKLLGNLDPVREVLNSTPDAIRTRLAQCRKIAVPRYIAGAGCEIPAKTPDANLRAFAEFARGEAAA